jgi:cysteine desulfurase
MAANNETGVLQPWQALADLCRTHAVLFHCDAAQWIGKLPLAGLGQCDFLTASGHKFGGPKGVGLLKAPRRLSTLHAQYGGHQEHDRRAGTENVPAVLSTTAALQNLLPQLELLAASAGERRDAFESQLRSLLPGIQIIGASSPRLWNTSMLVMPEFPNVRWVARLSDRGFSISTGSACSTGRGASEVLSAMDVHPDALRRVLRVSSAASTTPEHWSALARAIFETWNDLRQQPASRAARNAKASQ